MAEILTQTEPDQAEMDRVVREHGPAVWRTIYRLLNHEADARDCYQDTFLAAMKVARREPVRQWGALLKRIATTRAIDRLRRRYALTDRLASTPVDEITNPVPDPQANYEVRELAHRLRVALTKLPANQAAAFTLHCVEQLSHDDVAAQLGVSPGNARVLVHRARQRLQQELESTVSGGLHS